MKIGKSLWDVWNAYCPFHFFSSRVISTWWCVCVYLSVSNLLWVGITTEATIGYYHDIWAAMRFFTFYDTASIVIRFCDTLWLISHIFYVSYIVSRRSNLCAVILFSTLTSFPIFRCDAREERGLVPSNELRNNVVKVDICTKLIS